jgi:hypothetical protein
VSPEPALLVAGHGSREHAAALECFALVDRVRALRPGLAVECGFLELASPPVSVAAADLVAAGATDVVVVPLMLLAAGHTKVDIPAQIDRSRLAHPGVRFRYARDLGVHPDLLEIVGERLAAATQPLKIEWPRRRSGADPTSRPDPATLVVRVESAFALDMQHLAPVIVERVNAHYGWRCVGKIVLKQGPVRRPSSSRPSPAPPLPEAERARIAQALAGVEEEGLRGALDRLGQAVAGARKEPPTKA